MSRVENREAWGGESRWRRFIEYSVDGHRPRQEPYFQNPKSKTPWPVVASPQPPFHAILKSGMRH